MKPVLIGLAGLTLAAMLGGCADLEPRQAEHGGSGYGRDDAALTTPSPIGGTGDRGGVLGGGHPAGMRGGHREGPRPRGETEPTAWLRPGRRARSRNVGASRHIGREPPAAEVAAQATR